ncbi:MAG: hypothetical protein RR585_09065 [Coprobacillus sp.]
MYKIVHLKDKTNQMVEVYPSIVSKLYSYQNDSYMAKQMELLFEPINNGKQKLLDTISQREDYSYYHGVHKIENPITHNTIEIKMNEFDIEVDEKGENHIIFDIIKGFSKNFYMISL